MPTLIASFGFKNGTPNCLGTVIDVRKVFNRNPYRDRRLRYKTGRDAEVAADIEKTPGFAASYAALRTAVAAIEGTVLLGCTGGHHRSVYLAERLSADLGVPCAHFDLDNTRGATK